MKERLKIKINSWTCLGTSCTTLALAYLTREIGWEVIGNAFALSAIVLLIIAVAERIFEKKIKNELHKK